MAPRTPKRQRTDQASTSSYDSKSIIIAIGKARCIFNVHEALLKKTSFFVCHGEPPALARKDDKGSNQTNRGGNVDNPVDLDMEKEIEAVHYHITTDIHTLQSFRTFVDSLYRTWPSVLEDKADCVFFLQAYVLGAKYNVPLLQNAIIDCFRNYPIIVTANLNHLVWMTTHTRDTTGLPMTAYLVKQIAFDIVGGGIEEYEKYNKNLPSYMKEGDSFVRYELVKAMANYARSPGVGDPATSDPDTWYVSEL